MKLATKRTLAAVGVLGLVGVGLAVYNRLIRAAGFEVIRL